MGQMNAGLPQQAAQSLPIGGLIETISATGARLFTDERGTFLKTGTMIPWSAKYAIALSRLKQLGTITLSGTKSGWSSLNYGTPAGANFRVYWNGTYYLLMPGCDQSAANPTGRYSTTLTGGSTNFSIGTAPIIAHCAHGNVVMIAQWAGTLQYIAANANVVTDTGAATGACSLASNGTTAVAIMAASSTVAGNILTGTTGTSWTSRTGTGTAITMYGVHWSPCLSAFLLIGSGATQFSLNKAADGYTQTVSMAVRSDYCPAVVSYQMDTFCASSPTVTLIGAKRLADNVYGFWRCTSAESWTFVVPWEDASLPGTVKTQVWYDSARSRFVAFNGSTVSNVSTFLFSTDGLTWTPSFVFKSPSTAYQTITGLCRANGLDFMILGADYRYADAAYDVSTDLGLALPVTFGMAAELNPASGSTYAVRVA